MERQQMERESEALIEDLFPGSGRNAEWEPEQTTFYAKGKDVLGLVNDLFKKTNVVRISIWHKERLLAAIPVVYGGLAAMIFPFLSLFSIISLLALNCKIVVEKQKVS